MTNKYPNLLSPKKVVKGIYNIGDSNSGGFITIAVFEGYTIGNKISEKKGLGHNRPSPNQFSESEAPCASV